MPNEIKKGKEFGQSIVTINEYDDDNYCDIFATKLKFTDEVAPKGIELTDLSNDGDGSVVGWIDGDTYKVSTQEKGQKVIFNEDCSKMFYGGRFCCDNIELSKRSELEMKEVYFNNVDTSHVTNMRFMFMDCKQLLKLDLSNFDTSYVTSMWNMFSGCENLKELNLSNFDTSNVTDMAGMFERCENLKELDLSNFNTSNVISMKLMFADCKNLKELDLSHFDTSQVENMEGMFSLCMNLESLKLNNSKLDDIAYLDGIFSRCDKLNSLETTDIHLKNEYQKKVVQKQNKMHSNIDLKTLKINGEKVKQKEKGIDKEE